MAMVLGAFSGLARVRVTVIYVAALAGVSVALLVLGPDVQDVVIRHASTNLHNLRHGHLGTLFDSAFVVDAGPVPVWLPGLICLLALFELLYRSTRLIVAFVAGHLGATVLVALGLLVAVRHGMVPRTVTRAADVGMSYGAVGVLGALSRAIPDRYRTVWITGWIGGAVGAMAVERDFTSAGHAIALVLGMLVSAKFGEPTGWTRLRWTMLGVSAAFGFLVLTTTGGAAVAGAMGGLSAGGVCWLVVQRNSSALASIQSERQESGSGSSSSSPGISHS